MNRSRRYDLRHVSAPAFKIIRAFAVLLAALAAARCAEAQPDSNSCAPNPRRGAQASVAATDATSVERQARAFFTAERYGCAASGFERAAALAPKSADLQYWLGLSLYSSHRLPAAALALRRAVQLDGHSAESLLALGVVEHDLGDAASAIRHWEQALQLNPGSEQTLDWIAKARLEAGQYNDVIDLLTPTPPESERLQIDLLIAYGRSGFAEKGIEAAKQTLNRNPAWSQLASATALMLLQRNRFQEALSVVEASLLVAPNDAELQLEELRTLLLMGEVKKAEPLAKTYRDMHPNTYDALYLTGLVHENKGENTQALQDFTDACSLRGDSYDARYHRGLVLVRLGRFDEAHEQLQRAVALKGDAPDAHFQMAAALRGMSQTDAARSESAEYRRLLQRRAQHDLQVSTAAQAAQRLAGGDVAGAISLYKAMVEAEPDSALAHYNLALAEEKSGDLAGQEQDLRAAIRLKPDFAAAQNQLGYLLVRQQRYPEAEQSFRAAIAASPQYAEAESNLGSILVTQGNGVEAERWFRDALAANPRYFDAWVNLAVALADRSAFHEAREATLQALRLDPQNISALKLLESLPADKDSH